MAMVWQLVTVFSLIGAICACVQSPNRESRDYQLALALVEGDSETKAKKSPSADVWLEVVMDGLDIGSKLASGLKGLVDLAISLYNTGLGSVATLMTWFTFFLDFFKPGGSAAILAGLLRG